MTADQRVDSGKRPDVDISALDQEFAKIHRRLAIEELAASASAEGAMAADDLDLLTAHSSVTFAVARARTPSLSLAYPSEAEFSSVTRITVALVLALSTSLLVWRSRRNGAVA
jgi:hypothetical protein